MFIGMMLVDAALAAWAVGILQHPAAPRWVRYLLVWLGVTLAASAGLVLLAVNTPEPLLSEKNSALIGPLGALVVLPGLILATLSQRRAKKNAPAAR